MSAWNSKRRVMRRYNQSARVYDTQYFEEQEAKIKTIMQNLHMPLDSIVLDAGCGTGLLIKHLANKTDFVVGLDISRGLLQKAIKKAQAYQNVALVMADADNMPFPNRTFGTVFAVTLLQNMPNPRVNLEEIVRVSKPTAWIAVTGLKKRFSRDDFTMTLKQAGLLVDALKLDEGNREYVCLCHKARR
jgi:ubiquinone/menaquinone biosynthesis C-methylase UbiE